MASSQAGDAIDVADFIDRQPVGAFQLKVLLICAAVLFLDGFEPRPSAMSRRRWRKNGASPRARSVRCSAPACSG